MVMLFAIALFRPSQGQEGEADIIRAIETDRTVFDLKA